MVKICGTFPATSLATQPNVPLYTSLLIANQKSPRVGMNKTLTLSTNMNKNNSRQGGTINLAESKGKSGQEDNSLDKMTQDRRTRQDRTKRQDRTG